MPKLNLAFAISCMLILFSCGSSNDTDDQKKNANDPGVTLVDQPASGKIFGEDFVARSGTARLVTSPENTWQVFLYTEVLSNPCDMSAKHGSLYVGFISTLTKGRDVSSNENKKNITLGAGADTARPHVAAAKGVVQIDNATDTTATGKLAATFDGNSHVNGSFTITKCLKKIP